MRKSPILADRVCKSCGETFAPSGTNQVYCAECGAKRDRDRKRKWYESHTPDTVRRHKSTEVCCICGSEFSSHFDGKPYCNLHYLRMHLYGNIEPHARKSTNTFDVQGDVTVVTTANGKTFMIDTEDLYAVKRYSWCLSKTGYLVANINNKVTKLHRYLLNPPASSVIDHINGDPTDNRRSNLRVCSKAENIRNTSPSTNSRTGIVGVKIVKSGKFVAQIMYNRKLIHLGTFDTLEAAASARREAEKRYFGDFAPSTSRT